MQQRDGKGRAFDQRQFERIERAPPALQHVFADGFSPHRLADFADLYLADLGECRHPFALGLLRRLGGKLEVSRLVADRGVHRIRSRGCRAATLPVAIAPPAVLLRAASFTGTTPLPGAQVAGASPMGVRPAALSAIASAATRTSPTRLLQPFPNTGQVFSDCRKRMRSSQ